MKQFKRRAAVITGAGSGFGLQAVRTGMRERRVCIHRRPQALRAAD